MQPQPLSTPCYYHMHASIQDTLVETVFRRFPLALEHPVSATPASEMTSTRVLLSFGLVAMFLRDPWAL